MRKRCLASFVFTAFLVSACNVPTISDSTEPYRIAVGDELGLTLGSSFTDFRTRYASTRKSKRIFYGTVSDCIAQDDEVFCPLSVNSKAAPKIGSFEISFVTLTFYKNILIDIQYTLAGYDRQTIIEVLQNKYGTPNCSSGTECEWRNTVSSLIFRRSEKDLSASVLELTLNNEMGEFVKRSNERNKTETNKAL